MICARRTVVCALAVAILSTAGCKKKQEVDVVEPVEPQIEKFPTMNVDQFDYVCVTMEGSYDKHGEAIAKLQQAMSEQGLEPEGPMFGIYYNSPADVPQDILEWEIGFPVTLSAEPEAPLTAKRWDFDEVVYTIFTGPYQSAGETYEKMFTYIDSEDGFEPAGPTLERFLDEDPDMVEPDDLQTEIWIPIVEPPPEPEPEEAEADEGGDDEEASEGDDSDEEDEDEDEEEEEEEG